MVGGGTGGCSMAAKLTRKLYSPKEVIVVDPSDVSCQVKSRVYDCF